MAGLVPAIHVFHAWQIRGCPALRPSMTSSEMMDKTKDTRRTVTVKIQGRVQGVYFRAWTYETAQSLGLDGWVRNADDGSVEAVFSGPPAQIEEMLERCKDGPRDAKVTTVTVTDEGGAPPPGFRVLATDRWR
jgi:acylphosphatase